MVSREDVIRMAREAGIDEELPNVEVVYKSQWFSCTAEELERFAALVAKHKLANIDPSSFMSWQEGYAAGAAAEREACAKVCDEAVADLIKAECNKDLFEVAVGLRDAIRARGQV